MDIDIYILLYNNKITQYIELGTRTYTFVII